MADKETDGAPRYKVVINSQEYVVTKPVVSGAQIRALGAIAGDQTLVMEVAGTGADRVIADDIVVSIEEGVPIFFYTAPPTTFG